MKNKNIKNNIIKIIVPVIFVGLFIYSAINICAYIFGEERSLYVTLDDHFQLDASKYYIWYNNGKKMVRERVLLSFIEQFQRTKNSGYITFKQLGTHLTHRSEFVYSLIYFVIFAAISIRFIIRIIDKKRKQNYNKNTNSKQMSLNI